MPDTKQTLFKIFKVISLAVIVIALVAIYLVVEGYEYAPIVVEGNTYFYRFDKTTDDVQALDAEGNWRSVVTGKPVLFYIHLLGEDKK